MYGAYEKHFLLFTTHSEAEYRAVGVRARYLDDAVMCLRRHPELKSCHTTRVVEVGEDEMVSLRHVFSATTEFPN